MTSVISSPSVTYCQMSVGAGTLLAEESDTTHAHWQTTSAVNINIRVSV